MGKIMLKLQGNLYDLWEVRSFEKAEQYSETANEGEGGMEYLIAMNRLSIATNANGVVLTYETEEARNNDMARIQIAFEQFEGSQVLTT